MPNYLQMGYYESGTASIEQGQKVVTGQGTAWSQIVRRGDDFGKHVGRPIPIASVDSDTQITLAFPWPGPTQAAAPYRVTFTPYELNYRQAYPEIDRLLTTGNVSALAGLTGAANRIPLFTGPGAMGLIAKEDLINGVRFDVQVPDIASRAAYDNEAAGFTVLVADVGDGRSAIYTKSSVAAADWSDPAYLTGPKGDTGSPWDDWQGPWQTATAYAELAGVENGGSSYICTTAHTSDAASEPGVGASWNTYWDLVAAKGADGLGTGDVVGPASSTDNHVALFDGPTGKLLKDGFPVSTFMRTLLDDVDASAALSTLNAGILSGFRNKIINGDFDVWQRGDNLVSDVGARYLADRWAIVGVGSSISATRWGIPLGYSLVAGEPRYYHSCTVSSVSGAGNHALLHQNIESVRTLAGKTATLTFYARSPDAAHMSFEIVQVFGSGGSPSSPVTAIGSQKINLTTEFQKFSFAVAIPSVAGKILGTDGNDAVRLNFWFDAGSDFNGRTGSLGHQSGTFDLAHISLVEGGATAEVDPFSPRHIQQEEALCLRYFELCRLYSKNDAELGSTNVTVGQSIDFAVTKRVPPTIEVRGTILNNASNVSPGGSTESHAELNWAWENGSSVVARSLLIGFSADAEL